MVHHPHLSAIYLGHSATVEFGRRMNIDPAVDTDHRADKGRNEAEIVRNQDDRQVSIQILQKIEEISFDLVIEACSGFVEDQHVGIGNEGPCQQNSLTLAPGEV